MSADGTPPGEECRFEDDAARMWWTDIRTDGAFRVLVPSPEDRPAVLVG